MPTKQGGDLPVAADPAQRKRTRITRNAAGLMLVLMGFAMLLYAMTVARLIG